ncbi:valacyclovir hydrolase isoform X2 [Rhinichthys klamathensis goyatoka]|uniref:valacyclovir hydrolase isoform X2 n=1 Tax=Rhinichthys klamathensis goyatoka TaxID=3034132 RepID=UPI0024B56703|nr:valacyclovir hydrolase isoform X2 [Rhinichthys klamathensis goyatoka]
MATLVYRQTGLLMSSVFRRAAIQRRFYGKSVSDKMSVNGVNLHYHRAGDGKHAVLLLPGALGSAETDFGPQLEQLDKKRFTLVAFDPRGYGHSRPPDRDFPENFFHRDAKDALDLMQALGFRRFSLLGWSDGGITALISASLNPELINQMVVWGANAYVSKEDVQIYQGNICMEALPLISCPTLIVHGAKDPMIPSSHPQHLQQNISGSRLHVMPEGKHNLHLRYSSEFNALVEGFLSP